MRISINYRIQPFYSRANRLIVIIQGNKRTRASFIATCKLEDVRDVSATIQIQIALLARSIMMGGWDFRFTATRSHACYRSPQVLRIVKGGVCDCTAGKGRRTLSIRCICWLDQGDLWRCSSQLPFPLGNRWHAWLTSCGSTFIVNQSVIEQEVVVLYDDFRQDGIEVILWAYESRVIAWVSQEVSL